MNTIRKRLADGSVKTFYYHRPTGERLPGAPGDPEFLNAYVKATAARSRHHDGTLSALIHAWSLSPKWTDPPPPVGGGYAETTRREYRRMLVAIERRFGDLPIDALEDSAVRQDFLRWRAKVASESGAREADHRLAVLSALLSWAKEDAGEIGINHLKGFRRLHAADRSEMIWLPEHIRAFMKTAPLEMQRALILALHTGQRHFGQLPRPDAASCRGRESAVYIRRANRKRLAATAAPRKRTKKPKENKGMHGQLERLVGDAGLAFPSDFSDLSENRGKRTPLESFRNLSVDPAPERPRTGPPGWPPDPKNESRRPVGGPDGDIRKAALAGACVPQRQWTVNSALLVMQVRP